MSAPIIFPKIFKVTILLLVMVPALQAQENDDLYYSRKDRLKTVEAQKQKDAPTYWNPNASTYQDNTNYQDNQNATNVDSSLIKKYANQAREDNKEKVTSGNTYITNNYNSQNSSRRKNNWGNNWNNYSNYGYNNYGYNNYGYNNGWNMYPSYGFGYNNFGGFGSSIGFGYSSGWGYGANIWNNGWGNNYCFNSWYSPYN
ncbi:MAG: hypothetical protein RIQ70_65, partial [Bacteroidota bacterium]